MPDPSPRLKLALARRAKKRAAMERAWTEMVEAAYAVEEGLTSLHNRALRQGLARNTVQALKKAQTALAGAVLALEDDPCVPPARGVKGTQTARKLQSKKERSP